MFDFLRKKPRGHIRELKFDCSSFNCKEDLYTIEFSGIIPTELFDQIRPIFEKRVNSPHYFTRRDSNYAYSVPSDLYRSIKFSVTEDGINISVAVVLDSKEYERIQKAVVPYIQEDSYAKEKSPIDRGLSLAQRPDNIPSEQA